AEQRQPGLDRLPTQGGPLGARGALLARIPGLQRVHELHDGGDGGVEVEVALEIVGDLLDRLVECPPEAAAGLAGRRRAAGWRRPEVVEAPDDEAPDTVEEARGALDTLIVPLEILLGRR